MEGIVSAARATLERLQALENGEEPHMTGAIAQPDDAGLDSLLVHGAECPFHVDYGGPPSPSPTNGGACWW